MQIRAYTQSDESEVIKLWRDCDLVVPWNDPVRDIQRKLQVDPELFLVGYNAQGIVASVMGGYEGHRGWINYLAVRPGDQRRGYGRLIMAAVEERIAQRGCPKINLQVRSSNKDVIAFYQSLGYTVDDVVGLGKRLKNE